MLESHRDLLIPLATVLLGASIAGAQVPQILYYRMNEGQGTATANDAVPGIGNTSSTFTGTLQWVAPGKLGGAHLDFGPGGSASGLIETGWATDLRSDWTLEYWFTPAAKITVQ